MELSSQLGAESQRFFVDVLSTRVCAVFATSQQTTRLRRQTLATRLRTVRITTIAMFPSISALTAPVAATAGLVILALLRLRPTALLAPTAQFRVAESGCGVKMRGRVGSLVVWDFWRSRTRAGPKKEPDNNNLL